MSIHRTNWAVVVAAPFLWVLSAQTPAPQARFDFKVRTDLFAGFAGDAAALNRGMETCEKVLAENPDHAEALVWHGTGTFYLSGVEFRNGHAERGMALSAKAIAEMDRAVALEPDNIGVRIPRGAALLTVVRSMPPDSPVRAGWLERARSDYQRAFDLQKDHLDRLGTHPLGELLQGLGDAYSRLDRPEDAQKFYALIQEKLQGTEYSQRASAWMETRQPLAAAQANCTGCHVGNSAGAVHVNNEGSGK